MRLSSESLFIDLGSSTTRVFVGDQSVFFEPSCVTLQHDQVITLGNNAFDLLGKNPPAYMVSFPVERGRIVDTQTLIWFLSAIDQSKLKTKWWSKWLRQPHYALIAPTASSIDRTRLASVLTAVWGGKWQLVDRNRAILASISALPKMSEVTLVVDIGGQTTQLGLLVGGNSVLADQIDWGGVMLTEAVQRQVWSIYQTAISWQTAEQVKLGLSFLPIGGRGVRGKFSVRGKHVVAQLGETTIIEASELQPAVEKAVTELITQIEVFFSQIPTDLVGNVLESGITLSGGGAQLLGLESRLATELKCPIKTTPNPQLDAIFGLRILVQNQLI